MMSADADRFDISIGGIPIRFCVPKGWDVPKDLQVFLSEEEEPKAIYEIQLLKESIETEDVPVYESWLQKVYRTSEGQLRIYAPRLHPKDVRAALRLGKDGRHILYLPEQEGDDYQTKMIFAPKLGMEYVLMQNECILLHSSVIRFGDCTLLFSGPSGIGKSTQAALWEMHKGAKILNGDRCVVANRQGTYYGCGSPYAGSSGIYKQEEAPIAGIVFLQQGEENYIEAIRGREAFLRLYTESILNTWDADYTKRLCDFIENMIEHIPMYVLTCRPDQGAVELTCRTIFEKGRRNGIGDDNKTNF